ncbi:carbohydrate kinase, partial [Burkholderia sp. Ac-20392]|nr:carbohydrate kinase [Burkholderia sp. Ac-20392]
LSPRDDRSLAVRHARFIDLYARTDAWFTTGV